MKQPAPSRKGVLELITLGVLSGFALLPFSGVAPNRVAEPVMLFVWQSGGFRSAALLVGILLLVLLLGRSGRRAVALIPSVIVTGALLVLYLASDLISDGTAATTRISGGPGFWGWILTSYLYGVITGDSKFNLLLPVLITACVLAAGVLDHFGPVREFAVKQERFFAESTTHLFLATASTVTAALAGIPAGILARRNAFVRRLAFAGANTVQTLPSLALFGLMIAPLAWISMHVPLLRSMGVRGIGNFPALIALSCYAVLPVLRNTYTGLKAIPAGAVEAGRGMGMNPGALLLLVELPLALPVILAGLRIAFVQAIGNAAVASLIGAGGLGYFIFQGLGQAAPDLILLGVIPLLALAVGADEALKMLERIITPPPLRKDI